MPGDKILIVDDEKGVRESLAGILEDEGFTAEAVSSGEACLDLLKQNHFNAILLDVWLPGIDGLETFKRIKTAGYKCPVIMISGHGTVPIAVEATRLGAFDFLEKPLERDRLLLLTRNAVRQKELQDENRLLKHRFDKKYEIIGESGPVEKMKKEIMAAAPTQATVIIKGESGTGIELAARMIHRHSKRGAKEFIQVNCAAIPEDLIESELFGHEKGSFTGATEKQVGKFEMAHKGTIFLDEIGDMSAGTQAKVLRVLEEGEIETIGSGGVKKVDVRVLSATNKHLEEEIKQNRFREDLYFRLNVIPISVPALRERKGDIPILVRHFTKNFCLENNFKLKKFSDKAILQMEQYHWKGNIRELKNIVERLVIMVNSHIIDVHDLPSYMISNEITRTPFETMPDYGTMTLRQYKEKAEKDFLITRLKENKWNILKTAEVIDTPRSNLYKKIQQYDIKQNEE